MKILLKIWTIATLIGFITSAKTCASELYLSMWDNSGFTVEIDHRHYSVSSHDLVIRNLYSGNHPIVISKNMYSTYGRRTVKRVVYSGFINIPSQSTVKAKVSRRNYIDIISIVPYRRYNPAPYPHPVINNGQFRQLKKRIMYTRFESDKLDIMEMELAHHYFTSQQVFELVSLFDYESYRVEVAKMAYHKTVDKQNFYLVYDAFHFSSSIDKLERYIDDTYVYR